MASAASKMLKALYVPKFVYAQSSLPGPPVFISVEAMEELQAQDRIAAAAKSMEIQSLPTLSGPPLPPISYNDYQAQKNAKQYLTNYVKTKRTIYTD